MAGSNNLSGIHMCLLAADFLSLQAAPEHPGYFLRKGRLVRKVEVLGLVVSLDRRDRYLRFILDDGSGCVECVLWTNYVAQQEFGRQTSSDQAIQSQMALALAHRVTFGRLLRVQGRATTFRGQIQITVSSLQEETDPNAEVYHWMHSIELALTCYDERCPEDGEEAEKSESKEQQKFGLFQLRTSAT